MPHPISPKPPSFTSEKEHDYWHSAQDIAYRVGLAIFERDGASWLKGADNEELLCQPLNPNELWFQSYLILDKRFSGLSRLWVKGRPLTKPGQPS